MAAVQPVSKGKLKINTKPVTAYLAVAVIAVIFLIFFERKFGVCFIAALLFAPIASFVILSIQASKISLNIALSHDMVSKGESINMTLKIENTSLLPLPFLHVGLSNRWNLVMLDGDFYIVSVSKFKPCELGINYKAQIWGSASLGVNYLAAYDYLGMFKIEYNPYALPLRAISIRPAIHESKKNDLLSFMCSELTCDEKEDIQSDKKNFLVQPGYKHRPYVIGDPLSRVNWKLSARLDKYMVRENEYLKSQIPNLILDCRGSGKQTQEAALLEERIVEAVLAMLGSMIKQDMSCKVYYFLSNSWHLLMVENEEQIFDLQQSFAKINFNNTNELPDIPKSGMSLVFSCASAETLQNIVGENTHIILPATPSAIYKNLWVVNEAYDFYAL